ncbi:MAG: type II secretion system F family protein [Eggerthellaceae bacterium]
MKRGRDTGCELGGGRRGYRLRLAFACRGVDGDPGIGAVVGAAASRWRAWAACGAYGAGAARPAARPRASPDRGQRAQLAHARAPLRTAASHVEDPLREELARVLADTAYGTTLAMAFERMARRTDSPDVRSLAAAVRIQQRFGGAVAPVLDLIAAHAAARLRTSRELKTELAGTRLAKWFVALAMPAIFSSCSRRMPTSRSSIGNSRLVDRAVSRVLGGVRAVRLPAHHGDGSEPKVIAAERARRFARCSFWGR